MCVWKTLIGPLTKYEQNILNRTHKKLSFNELPNEPYYEPPDDDRDLT